MSSSLGTLLGVEITPAPWAEQAACTTVDPELFYPEPGRDRASEVWAKQVCRGCPVQVECLEHALKTREHHGIWGGLTPAERFDVIDRRRMPR